jgi:hypothetical protein
MLKDIFIQADLELMEIYLKEAIYGPYFNSQLFSILNGFKKEDVIPHLDKWPNVKFDKNLKVFKLAVYYNYGDIRTLKRLD